MNGLSREARMLLERARAQHEPTTRDRETVLRGLAPKLPAAAVLAGAAVHASSVAASTAPVAVSASLVAKWLAGGLVVGALGLGAGSIVEGAASPIETKWSPSSAPALGRASPPVRSGPKSSNERVEPTLPDPVVETDVPSLLAGPMTADPPPSAPPLTSGSVRREAPSLPPVVVPGADPGAAAFPAPAMPSSDDAASKEASRKPAPSPVRSADLLAEARALREAQTALDEGRAAEALALVEAQSRQFASGELQEERNAARLLALCALGQSPRVAREVAAFLRASSASPLAPRVRKACLGR